MVAITVTPGDMPIQSTEYTIGYFDNINNKQKMKRAMSNRYSHRRMIIGEFHVTNEKQIINT